MISQVRGVHSHSLTCGNSGPEGFPICDGYDPKSLPDELGVWQDGLLAMKRVANKEKIDRKLDDGWPESAEEHVTLVLLEKDSVRST